MAKIKLDFTTDDNNAVFQQLSDSTSKAIAYRKAWLSDDHAAFSLKMVIDRHEYEEKVPYRSDLELKPSREITLGTEIVYRFCFRFSNRWVPDPIHDEILAQWLPDNRTKGGPCLAFYLRNRALRLESNNPKSNNPHYVHHSNVLPYLADTEVIHRWTALELRMRWSKGDDGMMKLFRDGELIRQIEGPNCDSTQYSPYFKFGPYKWSWNSRGRTEITRRVIYFQYVEMEW